MFLIGSIEFLRFKKPKTKRCKTLFHNVLTHTFTAPQGMYGVLSGAKVRINPETCKHLGRFIFEEDASRNEEVYGLQFTVYGLQMITLEGGGDGLQFTVYGLQMITVQAERTDDYMKK